MSMLLGIYQMLNGKERKKMWMMMDHEKCKDMMVRLVQIGQSNVIYHKKK